MQIKERIFTAFNIKCPYLGSKTTDFTVNSRHCLQDSRLNKMLTERCYNFLCLFGQIISLFYCVPFIKDKVTGEFKVASKTTYTTFKILNMVSPVYTVYSIIHMTQEFYKPETNPRDLFIHLLVLVAYTLDNDMYLTIIKPRW